MLVEQSHAAFPTAPHLRYPGVGAWFTAPAGVIVQFQAPVRGTVDLAQWLIAFGFEELDRRFAGRNGLIIVLDFQLMNGRSAAARSLLLAKARKVAGRFARAFVIPPRNASTAHHYTLRAGVELVRALGLQVELADSTAQVIRTFDLRALG